MNMVSKASLTAVLLAGAALSACATTPPRGGEEANRGVYSLNQPVVQRTDYVLDLQAYGGGLADAERARLGAWFQSLGLGYGDRLFVEDAGDAAGRSDVARVAAEYGLLVGEGAPITAGQVQPGTVRVIVSRSSASVPNCPNWDHIGGPSATSSNYGCAVNTNLAAMVADPADLVLGQAGSTSGDAATSSKAIRVYREAAPTGSKGLQDTKTRGNN
jgi:pilus assembly protein CpaD